MTSEPPDPTRCGTRPRARPRQRPHGPVPTDPGSGRRTEEALERLRATLVTMEERLGIYIDEIAAASPYAASPSADIAPRPAPTTDAPSPTPPATAPDPADPATITVVVADGNDRFRRGLVGALDARPGIRVVGEAADGRAALDLIRGLHPQVVVCDLHLPGTDGVALVREIARAPRLLGVRIAVLAGHDDELVTMRARAAGANTSIDRSMGRAEICDVVEALATG